jgi:choline-sulfatase
MSDEHNPLYSSPYGNDHTLTPNMQKLADEGVCFQNAYCPSPLCLPSRSAFISGKRVHEIQTYSNCNVALDKEIDSYGKMLDRNGIHSVHIGKVDVYADGEDLGFSEMIRPGNRNLPGDVNHSRTPMTIRQGAERRANGFGTRSGPCEDEACVDETVEWIKEKGAVSDKPWVLCVNVVNPHFPHICPEEFWNMYENGDLPEYGMECETAKHPYAVDLRAHFKTEGFSEEQARGLRRGYYGCVSFVDSQLGRVMDAVSSSGLKESTNIVYTSDHGEMLGKFGMWWKCSMYEDSVRIPLIAAGPDFAHGKIVKTASCLHDLNAFIYKTARVDKPTGLSGVPLDELAEDDKDRFVFSEYHGHGVRSGAYMIRKGDWKFIMNMEAENQLFNLADDPEELNNLISLSPEKTEEMENDLWKVCDPENENKRAHDFEKKQLEIIKEEYMEKVK